MTEFVRGLLPNIKTKILADIEPPKNMSQALKAAIKCEDILQEHNIHVNNINTQEVGEEDIMVENGKKIVDLLEKIYISQEEGYTKLRSEMGEIYQQSWENGSPYNNIPKQHKECNYCGKMGHVRKQCFIRMNDEQSFEAML